MRLAILSIFLMLSWSQSLAIGEDLTEAISKGAEARVLYRIVDESGLPLTNVMTHVWFDFFDPRKNFSQAVMTDSRGMVDVSHLANKAVGIWVDETRYYRGEDKIDLTTTERRVVKDGRWEPHGEVRQLCLRRIEDRGGLMVLPEAKRGGMWSVPLNGKWLGFDLEVMDWVEPNGVGKYSDMMIRLTSDVKNWVNDFKHVLEFSFTDIPHAGVCVKQKNINSALAWEKNACVGDTYCNEVSFTIEKRPDGQVRRDILPDDAYFVFRTRTKVDDAGNLQSAHYGVICGRVAPATRSMHITDIVFNPKPNDLCLEDGLFLRESIRSKQQNCIQ